MTLARFAAHLGFPADGPPLFDALHPAGDPVEHIRFAADQGLGGVCDPFTAMRHPAAQAEIGDAAARLGLAMGSFLYLPFDRLGQARWGSPNREVRAQVLADIEQAIALADRLGGTQLVMLSLAEPDVAPARQHRLIAERLREAGDRVGRAGMTLCVEGVNPQRLPNMAIYGVEQAASLVRQVDHPAVRLAFDSGHALAMEEDPVDLIERHHDIVGVVQIAGHPGRSEPDLNAPAGNALLDKLTSLPAIGLIELEHGWSRPGAGVQRDYLARLRQR